jgi:hypothetical protein
MIFPTDTSNWIIIHKSGDAILSELLKNEIESNEIKCFIVNKKDTMYPLFGSYLLYVSRLEAAIAKTIIDVFLDKNETETE